MLKSRVGMGRGDKVPVGHLILNYSSPFKKNSTERPPMIIIPF